MLMLHPVIFKQKEIAFRYVSWNLHNARCVIRYFWDQSISFSTWVAGYQKAEVKNQSNLSRSDGCYLLVQVNFLPNKGISRRPKAIIASLKGAFRWCHHHLYSYCLETLSG
jgi:hypothetical protein